jgi:hypothetical protein
LKARLEAMAAGDILVRHDELQELASGCWPAVARA